MATIRTNDWNNGRCPYFQLVVNISSQTNTTATLSYTVNYVAISAASTSVSKSWSANIAGKSISGSYSINRKTGTNRVTSGSTTVNKKTSAYNASLSIQWNPNLTWAGVYASSASGSGSISIPAGVFNEVPNPPTECEIVRNADDDFTLTWVNNPRTGGIANNILQVSINDGAFTTVSNTIDGDATTYNYTDGETNSKYVFRIASSNSVGTSSYTEFDVPIYTTPAAPENGYAYQVQDTVYVNALTDNIRYPVSFKWQRSLDGSTDWVDLSDTTINSLTDTCETDSPYYRVRCVGYNELISDYSPVFQASLSFKIYINIPDGANPQKIYVNIPDGSEMKGIYINI